MDDFSSTTEYIQEFTVWWNKLMLMSEYPEYRAILNEYKGDIYEDFLAEIIEPKRFPN